MERLRDYLTGYDKILIIFLLIVSLIGIFTPFRFLLSGSDDSLGEKVIVIQSKNKEQERIPISSTYREEPFYIKASGPLGISIIEAHNGKVRLKEAPPEDPEKICVKTGWIEEVGPMIVCVPNQISIWIEREDSDLDGISW